MAAEEDLAELPVAAPAAVAPVAMAVTVVANTAGDGIVTAADVVVTTALPVTAPVNDDEVASTDTGAVTRAVGIDQKTRRAYRPAVRRWVCGERSAVYCLQLAWAGPIQSPWWG